MEYRILGPVQALHAGAVLPLGGPRHRRLLAVLLLYAGEVVSAARLTDALWGGAPPRSAPAVLHVRLSELRAALRPGRPDLRTREGGYLLNVEPDQLDARRFERLVADGTRALAAGDPLQARADLGTALALWQGPALAEFADEPFARAEATRLATVRLQALERRIAADLELGRPDPLVPELEKLVAEYPLRERFWAQLMLALYRTGRQGEALEAYQLARRAAAEQLGIEPGAELRLLHARMLRQDPDLHLSPDPPRGEGNPSSGNLPAALTSFVGRHRELAEIRPLLRSNRLVTLTGVGGAGKSRLAIELASACRPEFRDGVWLVELAALARPGLVPSAVAAALGIPEHPRRSIIDTLGGRLALAEALLVLDNCEHLVDEVAEVADQLLSHCARLRILATSRERLGLTGETVRQVSGLDVPEPGVTGTAAVGRAGAVRLMVERAAAVQPGFALTDATAAAIAEVCRRLDGLPLALELAAGSVHAWGIAHTAARLDDPFGLLTRGSRTASARHRTLRAVVDWSYGLLDPPQRLLFDQLAVFAGGFTVEAAEVVCGGGEPPMAEVLARLVDKSLVTLEHPGTGAPRYRMLETLRAYGLERLAESGTAAGVRDRHAAYVLALAKAARRALQGAEQPAWLHRLAAEHDNIRAALAWSIGQGDAATAVRLAGSLYPLWDRHGHYREGSRWLAEALALAGPVPPLVRAHALDSAAGLAVLQGDLDAASEAAAESAALSRSAGDQVGEARALTTLGLVAIYADDIDRAVAVLERALRRARGADYRWPEAFALLYLAFAALAADDHGRAGRLLAQSEPVLHALRDQEGLSGATMLRGVVAWRAGDPEAATAALRDGVAGFESIGHQWGLSLGLVLAAWIAGARSDHERAVSLLASSEALRDSIGAALMPFIKAWVDQAVARARAALDPATMERAWQAGRTMPAERALADALRGW